MESARKGKGDGNDERRTDSSGLDAVGDYVAERLAERDVALFEDGVEELRLLVGVSGVGGRCAYDRVELRSPLDGHGCGVGALLILSVCGKVP